MQITTPSWVSALAVLGTLLPTSATAQPAEACGTSGLLLFHCSFEQGAKQVGVCLTPQAHVSYQYGPDWVDPELSLGHPFSELDYVPFSWASNTIFESVMFRNGDTSYTVFSSLPRGENMAPAAGGITIKSPAGAETTINCDTGSVLPRDPSDGIGVLAKYTYEDLQPALQHCVAEAVTPQLCAGLIHDLAVEQNQCDPASDQTECWADERDAWDVIVDQTFTTAADIADFRDDAFVQKLRAAQESWQLTRDRDCELAMMLPFAADGGAAKCHAEYNAARVGFLQSVAFNAAFDG